MTLHFHVRTLVSTLKFICFSGAPSPFLGNQNDLASSVVSTVMENPASSSTGSSSPNSVFCSKKGIHIDSEEKKMSCAGKEHMENVLEEYSQKGRDVEKRLNEVVSAYLGQLLKYR